MATSTIRSRSLAALGALTLGVGLIAPLTSAPAAAVPCPDAAVSYGGGDGSEATPYLIAEPAHLVRLAETPGDWTDKHFQQVGDIALGGCEVRPIGTGGPGAGLLPFTGVYDGGGHEISGLVVAQHPEETDAAQRLLGAGVVAGDRTQRLGLFGAIYDGAEIRDLTLDGPTVVGTVQVGALVGIAQGSFGDWSVQDVTVIDASVTGTRLVGGLIGEAFNRGEVLRSRVTGTSTVTGTGELIGGLVGSANIPVEHSYVLGTVSGPGAGGLVGYLWDDGVSDSFARATVSGAGSAGLIGEVDGGAVTRSYAAGAVSGTGAGGLFAAFGGDPATASYWDTEATGQASSAEEDGAQGVTTAAMRTAATFVGWPLVTGWQSFDAAASRAWGICDGVNDGYPFLLWQATTDPCGASSEEDGGGDGGADGTGSGAAASWVPLAGAVPSLPAGDGVKVLADGTRVELAVSSSGPGRVTYAAEGATVTLTGAPGTSAANGLVAAPSGMVECEVCTALAAGGVGEVWIFSEPRLVAAWQVEDLPCQRFTVPVGAPLDGGGAVEAGTHTLQIVLPTASGVQAVNVGVTIGGVAPTSIPAGDGPATPVRGRLLVLALVALVGAAGAAELIRRTHVAG